MPRSHRFAPATLLIAVAAIASHARANAPVCRYTISGPTALDVETGLTWQRNAPNQHIGQDAAKTYCTGLSLSGGGWRLPTAHELQSILDIGAFMPAIDTATFNDGLGQRFWTSTPQKGDATKGWVVDFGDATTAADPVSAIHVVRCVR